MLFNSLKAFPNYGTATNFFGKRASLISAAPQRRVRDRALNEAHASWNLVAKTAAQTIQSHRLAPLADQMPTRV